MKIIFSNYDDKKNPYYGGGGAVAIHEVAKRLAVEFEVWVITGRYPGSKDEIIDNVHYVRIGFPRTGPKVSQLIFQFLLPFQAAFRRFDVWVESFTPPFSTAFLPYFTSRPVIGLTHLLAARNMAEKYKLPFDAVEKLGLKAYTDFIVLTPQVADKISAVNKKARISIIPNGIDDDMLNAQFMKQGEHILYIGRIDVEQKGIDLLIRAIASIRSNFRERIFIAGSGEEDSVRFLEENIALLGLRDRVAYVGKVSGNYKQELFQKAKFILMPSRFETLPLTLLEGFAFQCPAIIFDIPDLKWVPDDCVRRVSAFNAEKFGEAVIDLLREPERLGAMQLRASRYARKFSWESISSEFKKVLLSIPA